MSKPDDIPQDVWKIATRVFGEMLSVPSDVFQEETWVMDTEEIARAILAERERCAKVSEENGQPGFTDFVDGYNTACLDIAAAIRKGGE